MPRLVPIESARPGAAALPISARLRTQLIYFALPSEADAAEGEFRFDPAEVERFLDDGVIALISPLDTANMTEVELSEEQESLLNWLKREGVRCARVEDR